MSDLYVVNVNRDSEDLLPLSSIADSILPITLEFTNESIINEREVRHVFFDNSYIVVSTFNKLFIYERSGKYLRQIGRQGNGPGEFQSIQSLAVDFEKQRIYIVSYDEFLSYDFEGLNIEELYVTDKGYIKSMNYRNKELLFLFEKLKMKDLKGATFNSSVLYIMNDNYIFVDSIDIRKVYDAKMFMWNYFDDHVSFNTENSFVYIPELNQEMVIRDTLYCIENNSLKPYLRLSLSNPYKSSGYKDVFLLNVYNSTRFVFAVYQNDGDRNLSVFCYDTKKQKGYNSHNGYCDDIYNTGNVMIRPLSLDTDWFYYFCSNNKGDIDHYNENNATLYIGKLKK